MHQAFTWHLFFVILALVLGVLATFNVPSNARFNLFAGSFTAYLLAVLFT